jgi:hypothetical protein
MKQKLTAFTIESHIKGMGGWGNGYVAIPKDPPAFGKDYSDEIFDDIDVHGGLTYADKASKHHAKELQGMWIVGFDTFHLGDDMHRWPTEASVMEEANNLLNQLAELTIKTKQP